MRLRVLAFALLASTLLATTPAPGFNETHYGHQARRRATLRPWHGCYYNVAWGQPVALVVPPTAELTSDYRWGVCGLEVNNIYHQFQRNYPGYYMNGMPFTATPNWPSDTRQFGFYYVRGPW